MARTKKKILFINGHLNAGGVERSLIDVIKHMDFDSYDVDLLLLESYGDYLSEIPDKVNVFLYPVAQASGPLIPSLFIFFIKGNFFLFFMRIIIYMKSLFGEKILVLSRPLFRKVSSSYDAIISYRTDISTAMGAYVFKAKHKITWWHHGEKNFSGKRQMVISEQYKKMNYIVAVSTSTANMLLKEFPMISSKLMVIPNMVCEDDLRTKAEALMIIPKTDTFNIVTVGRMSPEKNITLCIKTALKLMERHFLFHWYIIGSGHEFEKISAQIRQNKLENHITLIGTLANPYPYIKEAHLLFHPSLVESQGLTILEAMALETPVICVKSEGPKEFIQDGINGFFIENDSEVACYKIIEVLSADNSQIIENAKNAIKKYSPTCITKKIEDLINS